MYDVWAKEKPKDDVWSFAYYLGSSAMRVCTNDVDENAWTKAVMGGEYKDVADFDGKYAAFDTCSQEQLIASCNVDCMRSPDYCATTGDELLNTSTKNHWLWAYWIKDGGGVSFVADTNITCSGTPTAPAPAPASVTPASATPASATPAATPSPSARRRMLLSSNSTNSTNSSASTPSPSAPGAEGNDIHSYSCPEFEAVCTCPAGTTEVIPSGANKIAHGGDDPRSFVSDPKNPNYKSKCSFNYTRFSSEYDPQVNCSGAQVLSVVSVDRITRFVLIGGTAAKFISILILYVAAYSTPANDEPRKNLKLSLCLSTPGALYYALVCCGPCGGEKGKKRVAKTLEEAPFRPAVDGFLAFFSMLCSLWLIIGLLLLTIGVEVNISTAFTWSACIMEIKTFLMNCKGNVGTRYKAKNQLYIYCSIPWPKYVSPTEKAAEMTNIKNPTNP